MNLTDSWTDDAIATDSSLPKHVNLRFLLSPTRLEPHELDPTRVGAVLFERTKLSGEAGHQSAQGTGDVKKFPADLVLVSIGYKGLPLTGMEGSFDSSRGTVVHEGGRIAPPSGDLGGLYASGWLKRGPSGIIGTNIPDAKDTVATIAQDLESREPVTREGDLGELLDSRGVKIVDWQGYRRIDKRERSETRTEKQPREKITDLQAQLETALAPE